MESTALQTIINRMSRWKVMDETAEEYKVRDIDSALRQLKRTLRLPWALKKSTLKVFDSVLEYPVESDHDGLAYVDNQKAGDDYGQKARFNYTSLKQFYENPDDRNDLAEIWDGGELFLGVRYKDITAGSQLVDNAEDYTKYSAAGDASGLANELVVFKEGNGSVKFTVTQNTNQANVVLSFNAISDANYKRKFFFVSVYLNAVPTSINLRFGNDNTHYLYSNITTQFSGQSFKANDWNLIALDLNSATAVGAVDSTAFDYAELILVGAASGTYYIDASYLRGWELMDYWYYSNYGIKSASSATPDKEYFYDTNDQYTLTDSLVGVSEWIDVIMYDAMMISISEKENAAIFAEIQALRGDSWDGLVDRYPSLEPIMVESRYRFNNDYTQRDED